VSEEDKELLAKEVELLCGSDEFVEPPALPDNGEVMSLVEIIEEYEAIQLWLVDGFPRLNTQDQAALTSKLGPFIPGSAAHLRSVLLAAFTIGIFTQNPIAKLKQLRRARENRHPGSEAINLALAGLYEQTDIDVSEMPRELVKQGLTPQISKDAAQKRIDRMIAAGKIQKRSGRL
jgi:hypothetical protein